MPQYRKFDDDAKESLAEIAWEAAQLTVADTLDEGDEPEKPAEPAVEPEATP